VAAAAAALAIKSSVALRAPYDLIARDRSRGDNYPDTGGTFDLVLFKFFFELGIFVFEPGIFIFELVCLSLCLRVFFSQAHNDLYELFLC
jgi:hypothetical protein